MSSASLVTVGGVIVAVILNKSIWGLRTFRTIYYLPSIMVGVGTYFLWMLLLDPANGLVNTLLGLPYHPQRRYNLPERPETHR